MKSVSLYSYAFQDATGPVPVYAAGSPVGGGGAFEITVRSTVFTTVRFAFDAAATVTIADVLTVGAVNSPVLLMLPLVAVQVTPVFVVPVTIAVNCCVPPDITVVPLAGETEITIGPVGVVVTTGAFTDIVIPATVLL